MLFITRVPHIKYHRQFRLKHPTVVAHILLLNSLRACNDIIIAQVQRSTCKPIMVGLRIYVYTCNYVIHFFLIIKANEMHHFSTLFW